MSTSKEPKVKITDAAKDLKITGQALSDFLKEKLDIAKKPAASITAEEMNKVLEIFSQENQVASFEEYFATRNDKPQKEENEEAEKKAPKKKPAAKKKDEAKSETEEKAEKPAKSRN